MMLTELTMCSLYMHFHFETTSFGAQISLRARSPARWRSVWSYRRHHERCMERNLFGLIGDFLMGLQQICRHNLKHNRPPPEIVS